MLTNGYKLKESLKLKQLELKANQTLLKNSFYRFKEDSNKPSPIDISENIIALEKDIATIQTAQKYYNVNSNVEVPNLGKMSLELAIKLLGGYGRKSKTFKTFSEIDVKKSRYGAYDETGPKMRKADAEYQLPCITQEEALEQAMEAEVIVSNLKSVIALANAEDMAIDFLDNVL